MVHDQVQDKLGFEYEDLGEQTLKNIAKPIRVYRLLSFPGAAAHRVVEAKRTLWRRWGLVALAAGALLVIAGVLLWRFVLFRARAPQVASVQKMAHALLDKPSIRKMSPMGEGRKHLAASLAYLGRMEEAHVEAEKFLKENPNFSAAYWGSNHPFLHDKDRQHAVEGFIKAGLPR